MATGYSSNSNEFPVQFYQEPPQTYGAFGGFPDKPFFARRPRKRLNIVAMGLALFVPWIFFTTLFAVMSFSLHYKSAQAALAFCGLVFFAVLAIGYLAVDSMRSGATNGVGANWYIFTFLSGLLAWSLGITAGGANFAKNYAAFLRCCQPQFLPSRGPITGEGTTAHGCGQDGVHAWVIA